MKSTGVYHAGVIDAEEIREIFKGATPLVQIAIRASEFREGTDMLELFVAWNPHVYAAFKDKKYANMLIEAIRNSLNPPPEPDIAKAA